MAGWAFKGLRRGVRGTLGVAGVLILGLWVHFRRGIDTFFDGWQ